jgi:hypothetical protein
VTLPREREERLIAELKRHRNEIENPPRNVSGSFNDKPYNRLFNEEGKIKRNKVSSDYHRLKRPTALESASATAASVADSEDSVAIDLELFNMNPPSSPTD